MNIFRIIALFWLIVDIGLIGMSLTVPAYLLLHIQISITMLIISILAIIVVSFLGKGIKKYSAMLFILVMGVTRTFAIFPLISAVSSITSMTIGVVMVVLLHVIMYSVPIIGDIFMLKLAHKFKSLET